MQFIAFILHYKYFIMVLLSLVEGPAVMMASGFFLKLGYVSFLPAYFFLMLGDLMADAGWYAVGYFLGEPFIRRFGKYVSITEEKIATVKRIFHKYQISILFMSKITMGFGFALVTLITAGIVKIPFRRYIAMNLIGQFVWTALLMSVGYFFGNLYLAIDNWFGRLSVFVLFVIVFLCLLGFGKYVRGRFTKTNSL